MPQTWRTESGENPLPPLDPLKIARNFLVALFTLLLICVGLVFLVGFISRYQTRADASNKVQVYERKIKQYDQLSKIAQREAEIRFRRSVGIKRAQDEISKTLTPLYVQFEFTQALLEIAKSGSNNSVVFVPTGAQGGLPTIVNPSDYLGRSTPAKK